MTRAGRNILLLAGEASGDMYGAALAREIPGPYRSGSLSSCAALSRILLIRPR